jgi:hypothetical protein
LELSATRWTVVIDGRSVRAGSRKRLLSSAIGLAYGVAAVGALAYARDTLRFPDEFEYLSIAQNLLQRGLFSEDGVTATAFRPPGWPALLAVLWWIQPSLYFVKIFNLACWAATGLVVARLSAHFHGVIAAHLAALLYLCYIYELYAATTLYPQTIVGLLVIASVALVVRATKLTPVRQIALVGLTTFQFLAVPNCIVVPAVIYPYAILTRKMALRPAFSAGCIMLLVILGWCYRNEQMVGGFTFATNSGLTLVVGNSDNTTMTSSDVTDISAIERETRGLSELDRNTFFRNWAINWIGSHPWRAFRLFWEKFAFWFSYENQYVTQVTLPAIHILSLATTLVYYPVLLGSLIAIGSHRDNLRGFAILAWIITIAADLSYAVFFTKIRYRLPFDPLLFVAAAGMILAAIRKFSNVLRISPRLGGA